MGFYESIGVKPVINVAAAFTALGGQLMPPEVLAAMNDAAGASIDMHELHLAAGRRLAQLTHNEAAYVTSGCAAAIVLAVLGIRTQGDPAVISEFPGHDRAPYEVIMHAAHRIPYDAAVALAGATVRQIGNVQQTFDWELESAIGEHTAAVLYVAGTHLPQVAIPLERVVEIAHARGIPVIVDAAAQLPPMENLWHFTRDLGADIAVFSGGKALRGPQASGLMVGNPALIEAARQSGAPYQRWARAMKAGKEEIAGLVAAVERFVSLDNGAVHADWLATVTAWADAVPEREGVAPHVSLINEAGQPMPRLYVALADPARAEKVLAQFLSMSPQIMVLPDRQNSVAKGFWATPDLMHGGEQLIVSTAITEALAAY
ncbi:MAG: aminotransferase class V-fold PLP-dependent enzyme [Pseudolysinimonas sp.]